MTKVWAAKCKSCGNLSGVRYLRTDATRRITDIPNPSQKHSVMCLHCGHSNELLETELSEVDAEILQLRDEPPGRPGGKR
jgi:hypothetical protein